MFARFGKKKSTVKTPAKDEEILTKKNGEQTTSSLTMESFVQKHSEIFRGLLTGENTLEFSDSDSEVSDDERKPKQRRIPVKLTRTQLAQQAAIEEAKRLVEKKNGIFSRMKKKSKSRVKKRKRCSLFCKFMG